MRITMNKLTMLSCITLLVSSFGSVANDKPFAIAIHGGAGTINPSSFTPEQEQAYRAKLKEAVDTGYVVLEKGGSSLEAVTQAINVLEDSPYFNAGKGAVYTHNEQHEMDASIMDGKTMNAGAVSGVKHVKNPIDLARLVMDKSVHVMLYGEGAEEFALTQGVPLVANETFNTQHRYESLQRAKAKMEQAKLDNKDYIASHNALDVEFKVGTVGAVALDKSGNISAGTSTGGMTNKRYGRIGDAPVIGAGTYAENGVCAVSATGHGEYFIRYHVAGDICAKVKYQGKSIIQAADEVINQRLITAGGTGGVIAIDHRGNIATPFNTEGMYRATRKKGEQAQVMIWRDK
ncbi:MULTISPECIES: isoaspartyl peptidase/L-asparaginase [unclassified Shewanella]|uniref:isoaspartyl peptidase/L-asparaginase family protein n=2 Tax=Shewanella TaxID=22 RepID=UPI000C845EAE|nr:MULTISPECIES: isoaspartyl peptidase/L-asparaginase [unclassified Shewanella]MDO6678225.1 isoaspartyl peptidase/L-asparaginase [Shewanella sp. 4_MG-2023]PMG30260.1 beta-aspartyl-peptidase [Shewanella sp. 10N.286.52.C2]PMG40016.1 beta-aspartyl-peptidase [Shewanella sp. 10N.286.52.B9]